MGVGGIFSECQFSVVLSVLSPPASISIHRPFVVVLVPCLVSSMLHVSCSCAFPLLICFSFVSRLDGSGFGTTRAYDYYAHYTYINTIMRVRSSPSAPRSGLGIPVDRADGSHRAAATTEQIQFAV